jgi:NADH-quinone oxidoreductase subunit N
MAVAAATLVLGNLAAIPQSNFKRLLGYSSIAHAGFLLLALGANTAVGSLSPRMIVAYYLAGYLFMSLTAFAVLVVINRTDGTDDFKAFNGLHQRSPFLAFAITVAAASLAGVPLTAGFTGKFLAFSAAAGAHQWALLAIAAAAASAGFYYYFKVLRHVFWNRPAEGAAPITVPPLTRLLVVALITCTFAAGILFQPFVNLLR